MGRRSMGKGSMCREYAALHERGKLLQDRLIQGLQSGHALLGLAEPSLQRGRARGSESAKVSVTVIDMAWLQSLCLLGSQV